MKHTPIRLVFPWLFAAALFVTISAAQQPASSPSPTPGPAPMEFANAERAKKLLDQMIAAMGGDKFLTFANTMQQGKYGGFHHGRPTGEDFEFWDFSQYPDKERVEQTPQRDIIELYNGDKGWEVTYKGPHEFGKEEMEPYMRRREYRLDVVLREWLKDPKVAFFYDGSDLVESQPVDKVTILNGKNQGVTLMIDSTYHLLAKKQYTLRDPQTGDRDEEVDVYGNYHLVQGIQTPYTTVHIHNGDISGERFLRQVTYNLTLPPDFFTPEGAVISKGKKKEKSKK